MRPVFVCSGMGQQWWAMGRELLTQEPVYRRAVEEVSDLFGQLAGWSLLDKLTADENNVSRSSETHVRRSRRFSRSQVGLAAMWRSWGVEPAAVLGHSAGEVAASYICGRAVARGCRPGRVPPQPPAAADGRSGIDAGGGDFPRGGDAPGRAPPARHFDRRRQRPALGHAFRRRRGPRRDRQDAQRSRPVQPRLCRWRCRSTARRWSSSKPSCWNACATCRPLPASTPFFSTVTGTALTGPGIGCAVLVPQHAAAGALPRRHGERRSRQGIGCSSKIGAHPILRYDIAACLNENVVAGTTLCSLRRDDRERAALLGIARPPVYARRRDRLAEAFSRRRRRRSSCRAIRSRPRAIGGKPIRAA